ncbi:CHRD domain-containing protein [Candidatus Nitrosocosmicus hydrocola]|uniref:CHRD domain-containing protein n=1 Tax=Candidatus Nitrosocosmicus hydrocola TaxID=1826872 RepID=UPI0018C8A08F|nr:CHRD domain-containing protein [Candidatus Nitrosocosmicus hydrocola]
MKISNSVLTFMLVSLTAAIAGLVLATGINPTVVFANHEFAANLTGQEEVPPVDTQAMGEAIFVPIQPRNETIDFYVNTTGIQAVTQAHIHSGSPGENGPIVVTLFTLNPVQNDVSINGSIAANNLEGPMQGKTVAELIGAIKNNTTYVNVHTEQNPNGEIRGQLADTP